MVLLLSVLIDALNSVDGFDTPVVLVLLNQYFKWCRVGLVTPVFLMLCALRVNDFFFVVNRCFKSVSAASTLLFS